MSTTFDELPRGDVWNWIRSHQRQILFATIGFQMIVLGSMIVQHGHTLLTGDTIQLKVLPVDPRDPLRGDYVILRYEFSSLWPQGSGYWDEQRIGQDVYVTLEPIGDGKQWRGVSASWERPTSGRYIRGRVQNSWSHEFGIEAYYVQEGQGKEYESARNTGRLSAEIALTRDGKATLKQLILK